MIIVETNFQASHMFYPLSIVETNCELCASTSNGNIFNRLSTCRFKAVNRIFGLRVDIENI